VQLETSTRNSTFVTLNSYVRYSDTSGNVGHCNRLIAVSEMHVKQDVTIQLHVLNALFYRRRFEPR
jgi:hypothetical protein